MARSRLLYRMLTTSGAPSLARKAFGGAPVFCFHNVVSDVDAGRGDASLHLAAARFQEVVAWISGTYEVSPLAEIVERARAGRSSSGLAALTFDDAYRGIFLHAIPHLKAKGLPCTVYVVPSFADHPRFTWWDRLGAQGALTEENRDHALNVLHGLDEVAASGDPGPSDAPELPASFLPADWDEILAGAGGGVDIGSHTARHANLTSVSDATLGDELVRAREQIDHRVGSPPRTIAYPYGHWDDRVLAAARAAGYEAGFTLGARPVRPTGEDPLALPRVNVPAGIVPEALECWAVGLNPYRWR